MGSVRLGGLGCGYRVGLTCLLACLAVGQVAGLQHMVGHYDKRDDRPGFTVDDIKSAYHGLDAPAPLQIALNRGHPEKLKEPERKVLLAWLGSGKIVQDYDNPDLGVASPKEIIASSCLQCHSAKLDPAKADPKARMVTLDTTEEIKKFASARQVLPTPADKVLVSIHAHAPSMALMSLAVVVMAGLSRWPRRLVGTLTALCGVGLICDFAGMWLARSSEAWIGVLLAGGAAFHLSFSLLVVLALAEMWLPGGKRGCCGGGGGGGGGGCGCGGSRKKPGGCCKSVKSEVEVVP